MDPPCFRVLLASDEYIYSSRYHAWWWCSRATNTVQLKVLVQGIKILSTKLLRLADWPQAYSEDRALSS